MINKLIFSVFAITFLQSCATSPERLALIEFAESTMPVCVDDADCRIKWEAAQLWVINNAAYRLQIATDVLLETYNPTDYTTQLGMRVTKEPLGGGQYRFNISAYCANLLGCARDPVEVKIAFNEHISATRP